MLHPILLPEELTYREAMRYDPGDYQQVCVNCSKEYCIKCDGKQNHCKKCFNVSFITIPTPCHHVVRKEFQIYRPDAELLIANPRSGQWPKARADWLVLHPLCRACGTNKFITVHHKKPYHKFRELELDPRNFVTLCESPSHNCHLIWGHLLNWLLWNELVEKMCDEYYKVHEEVRKLAA